MFDQVFGLPAHALIVHAAVIFVPLLVALSIAYAVLPRVRHKLDWALVATAVVALGAAFAAKESGEALEQRLFQGRPSPAIDVHSGFADVLVPVTAVLTVLSLLMVWLTWPAAPPRAAARGPSPWSCRPPP